MKKNQKLFLGNLHSVHNGGGISGWFFVLENEKIPIFLIQENRSIKEEVNLSFVKNLQVRRA